VVIALFHKVWFHYLFVTLAAMALFIPFNGGVHLFDWDEINFAESAREMLVSGDYLNVQVNFESFWEKPPFFIWMQAVSMKVFGVNEFAARFPNAVCGICTLLTLYTLGRKLFNEKFGLVWVVVYAGSLLPFVYFKSGIIDPWFNLFIFLSLVFVIETVNRNDGRLRSLFCQGCSWYSCAYKRAGGSTNCPACCHGLLFFNKAGAEGDP
jgi:4-amino-4-deoxy-L-arabinose transferase-like glycosyltransferase